MTFKQLMQREWIGVIMSTRSHLRTITVERFNARRKFRAA